MTNLNYSELENILAAFSSINLKGESQLLMAKNLINIKRMIFLFAKDRDFLIKKHFPDGNVNENDEKFNCLRDDIDNLFKKDISIDFSLFEKISVSDIDLNKENNQNYLAILLELGLITKNN